MPKNTKRQPKKTKRQKKLEETVKQKNKRWNAFNTYTKAILTFVLINSELQIWASYLLAYLGKDAIAESLSEQVVIVIIGGLIPYFAKSLIENLSKRTTLFGKNLPYENASGLETDFGSITSDSMGNNDSNSIDSSIVDLNTIDENS